jgi:hypothetical protein
MSGAKEAGGIVELSRTVSAEEFRPLLDRILNSRHFASSGRRKKFLGVVADYYLNGRADQLNEFCLACEVFGFDEHYDPAGNAGVRVCAHDVRKRLKEYFNNEGSDERLVVQIPPGAYKPVFMERVRSSPPPPPAPAGLAAPRRRWVWAVAVVAVLVVVGVGMFFLRLKAASERAPSALWKPLMEGDGPVLVVMSNPPLFQFLWASDPVRSKQDLIPLGKAALAAIERQLGANANRLPYLVFSPEDYTGMGEAMGLMHLTRFFAQAGREMLVKQSRTAGTEDFKNHHVVLVGGPLSNEWAPRSESLDFDLAGNFVLNRKPLPGEEKEYRLAVEAVSGQPTTDWAVITVAPGIAPGRTVMMLAGIRGEGTQAAAEFITDRRYSEQLQRRLRPNAPAFFQALLRVDVKKWQPAAISLVSVHRLPGR